MTMYSDNLKSRKDFTVVTLGLNVYCSLADCNTLMREGSVARKFDGATFTHIGCPTGAPKHTAAHRYPDTGLRIGN